MSSIDTSLQIAYWPLRSFLYPIIHKHWVVRLFGSAGSARIEYRKQVNSIVTKRLTPEALEKSQSPDTEFQDFFDYMLDARDPETGDFFERRALVSGASLLIGAGTHTSSTAMAATFYYLCREPRLLAKLRNEIRGTFSSVEEIRQGPVLNGLHYLRAVIDETLRISPPVPSVLARQIVPGGCTIDGHDIPAGTDVSVPIYVIHHNPKYFASSFTFLPERWLVSESTSSSSSSSSTSSSEKADTTTTIPRSDTDIPIQINVQTIEKARAAFNPFSLGPRNCIGKNLAYMEMSIALARVIYMYDFRPAPGWEEANARCIGLNGEFRMQDWFVADCKGPFLQFRVREGAGLR